LPILKIKNIEKAFPDFEILKRGALGALLELYGTLLSKSLKNKNISVQWIDVTRDAYKTKCKKRLIVEKLLTL